MLTSKILKIILLLMVFAPIGKAQPASISKYVYVLRITKAGTNQVIQQTGFRLAGTKGIVTALHGVVDGIAFTAKNENGEVLTDLRIVTIDVTRDLVLLRCPQLETQDASGLPAVKELELSPSQLLISLGHPLGINLHKREVKAGDPIGRKLHQLIPPGDTRAFSDRQSPGTDINVLSLAAQFVPGESGSPILTADGQVVGVVNGGLLKGAAGISWAIPITDVIWSDVGTAQAPLERLARLDSSNLFGVTIDAGSEASSAGGAKTTSEGILPGPVNEKTAPSYLGGPANKFEFRFKMGIVRGNRSSDVGAAANNLTNENGTHVWDSKTYYWRKPRQDERLLLAWKNLTNGEQGWVILEEGLEKDNCWWYKTNASRESDWVIVNRGDLKEISWDSSDQRITVAISAPQPVNGWTPHDVNYSFIYKKAEAGSTGSSQILPGPVNEIEAPSYQGGPAKNIPFRFKMGFVRTNRSADVEAIANNLANENGTHVWDSKTYYWRKQKDDEKLLLAWKNLANGDLGWVIVEEGPEKNCWFYKNNKSGESEWTKVNRGELIEVSWVSSRQRITVAISPQQPVNGWTPNDVTYSFIYKAAEAGSTGAASSSEILPGPMNEIEAPSYRGGPAKNIPFRFKMSIVRTNRSSEVEAIANNLTNENGTHVWDSKTYYWHKQRDDEKLLLAWKNLADGRLAWVIVEQGQEKDNCWFYKTNGSGETEWVTVNRGELKVVTWDSSDQRITVTIFVPHLTERWTVRDVHYSFGY